MAQHRAVTAIRGQDFDAAGLFARREGPRHGAVERREHRCAAGFAIGQHQVEAVDAGALMGAAVVALDDLYGCPAIKGQRHRGRLGGGQGAGCWRGGQGQEPGQGDSEQSFEVVHVRSWFHRAVP